MDNQKQSKKIQTPKFIYIVKLLIIFIPVVASSILALSFAYTTYKSPADKSSADRISEGSIAIIALAVSVWTGINIANAIERSEVEKLKQELDDADESIKLLEKQIGSSMEKVKSIEESNQLHDCIERKDFISVLESADDLFYRYISNLYKDDSENTSEDSLEINAEILRTIKGILHIKTLHEKGNKDSLEHIYNYSNELISNIDSLLPEVKSNLSKSVLMYIQSEAGYYNGFSRYEYGNDKDRFIDVARIFKNAAEGFERKRNYFLDGAPNIIECHYYNALAQCYSEILNCFQKSKGNEYATAKITEIVSLKKARRQALHYTEQITTRQILSSEYPFSFERINKNCGVAIERIAMNQDYILNLRKAIQHYESAAEFGAQRTSGYALCSAYNKYIRKLISPQEIDFITNQCNESLWEKGSVSEENLRVFKATCAKLEIQTNRWRQLFPSESLFNYLYIMSQIYLGIIEDDSQRKIRLERIRPDIKAVKLLKEKPRADLRAALIKVFENIDRNYSGTKAVKNNK